MHGVLSDWDQVAEQMTRQLPAIEPVRIAVCGDMVCLSHADVAFSRKFGNAEQADDFANSLRCELFDQYAALADEALMTFSRQAIADRNG